MNKPPLYFPPVQDADEEGLLAIGGDLSCERLELAYRSGIFPWYSDEDPILWWSPDPRFVLHPNELKISKSMQQILRRNEFRFTMNMAFESVIHACKTNDRAHQQGTWIVDEMEVAYIQLHRKGLAHSAECWMGDELVGGLYGIRLEKVFCGESMFSLKSNASKFAFIHYVQHLEQEGIQLIDCQVYTDHLASLGASMMRRNEFLKYL
ncbi:MAG: leucyl/phenylalanyl-tRNA--protein transferase [Chitinophagaceae bacterium]|nr:leucyl/phenylalanyl-tRNA--protein transferase [Chitinophagaceae bacterium]